MKSKPKGDPKFTRGQDVTLDSRKNTHILKALWSEHQECWVYLVAGSPHRWPESALSAGHNSMIINASLEF